MRVKENSPRRTRRYNHSSATAQWNSDAGKQNGVKVEGSKAKMRLY